MSPSRAPSRGYRPPRDRRELLLAILGVAVVLVVAVGLIWILAPDGEPDTDPVFTPPPATAPDTATTSAPE